MKKSLIFSTLTVLCVFQTASANFKISWHEARKAIIKKAEYVTKSYDTSLCVWTTKMSELVLAKEFETESWEIVQRIIEEIMPQLPIYKKFLENPHDDIYLQELLLQASMIAGQIAAQVHENFEFGAKTGAIIGGYIEVLKETLRKK